MITTNNVYTIDMPQIFDNAAKELVDRQASVAGSSSVKKSGRLADYLKARPYHVGTQDGDTTLMITYPIYSRYIDLQFRKGKPKKKVSIYNKLVWGFLMGYIYRRTRGGVAKFIAEKLRDTKIEI